MLSYYSSKNSFKTKKSLKNIWLSKIQNKKMHVVIQAETNAKDKKRLILRNEDEISS